MKRICYISKAKTDLSDSELHDLIAISLKNNLADQITGILLYDGNRFLQVIEGDEDKIDMCFNRISNDVRHDNLSLLENGGIADREFGSWALECRRSINVSAEEFRALILDDVKDVSNIHLKAIFIGFAALIR